MNRWALHCRWSMCARRVPSVMISSANRRLVVGLALVGTLAISGCGNDEPEVESRSPAAEPSTTTTTATDPDVAAAEAITAIYHQWWDAVIQAENEGLIDAGPFEGLATNVVIDRQLLSVRTNAKDGILRVGEPTVSEPVVTVDGDTARAEGCVDESTWGAEKDGEPLPSDTRGPTPRVFDFVRQDGTWIVSERMPQEEATITC